MDNCLKSAKEELDSFHELKSVSQDAKEIELAKEYLTWVQKKTTMILNEKNFSLPEDIKLWEIKRGSVFWAEFGYNIDEEFGGRHPALVLRRGGNTVIVLPLSTQEPTEDQKNSGIYVEIPKVWGFRNMTRWVNVLNATPISIQRIDFSGNRGNVKGPDLDNINKAMEKAGLWSIKKQHPVAAAAKPKDDTGTL
jgi:mRNA-degrading endonuclease toxin of MazEF toxin-antitoxin module